MQMFLNLKIKVKDSTYVQKLKFVLALKHNKISVYCKNNKKAIYDNVIIDMKMSLSKFLAN